MIDLGQTVREGTVMCTIHARTEDQLDAAEKQIRAAYRIGEAPEQTDPVLEIIS